MGRLAEYSRVLVGLRNRMEKVAATEAEGQALGPTARHCSEVSIY